ncbi:MAG: DegQ family serine endoprotease [Chloroflexota bacterium]
MKIRSLCTMVTFLLIGVATGIGIPGGPGSQAIVHAEEPRISKEAIDILTKTNQAISEVAAAVKPSVVNVSTTRTIRTPGNPFFDDPFFRRFFGDEFGQYGKPRERKQASLGSGVIVDRNGYVLTNNHVIKDADDIRIKLADTREFKGKVVGTDPKTDLAVIKIEANHLQAVRMGDSDRLKVGEMVIAVGNPFGLNQTVTSGIVSATGRANVGIADYEDFIQTDAAINPGNSGGALVNVRGELVGINTAIFSTTGGYQGIGFAIPSNMAKVVMESLIKTGKVVRGWFGVTMQPVTPDLAKEFGLSDERGAIVADVAEGSPAAKAGIRRGDVIIEFDGKEVNDVPALRNMVAAALPNREVTVKLLREKKVKTVRVAIKELPHELQVTSGDVENNLKGVSVQNITPELRKGFGIPKQITGVVITDVEEGSPVYGGFARGDVITEINRKAIKNTKDYEAVVSKLKPSQNVLVLIYRNGRSVYYTITGQ